MSDYLPDIKNQKVLDGYQVLESLLRLKQKVTKNKIATEARFSPSLLTPTKGKYKTPEWEKLAQDIDRAMRNNTKRETEIDKLRASRDEAKDAYIRLVKREADKVNRAVLLQSDLNASEKEIADLRQALSIAETKSSKYYSAYQELLEIQRTKATNNAATRGTFGRVVISPDEELAALSGEPYRWEDPEIKAKAHSLAQTKLMTELVKPIPTRLYLTIGLPGSGKSTWIKVHVPNDDCRAIYYDSTGADIISRQLLCTLAQAHPDCVICYVFFTTPVSVCIERCAKRKDKPIHTSYINSIQIDNPLMSEPFHELIKVGE